MKIIAGGTIIAAALVMASTVSAFAGTPSPSEAPIAIGNCTLTEVPSSSVEGGFQGLGSADLAIGFVNRAAVTATGVRFVVRIGGTSQTFEDSGSFAAGTQIEHVFTPLSSAAGFGDASCAVDAVTFSDGTSWRQ